MHMCGRRQVLHTWPYEAHPTVADLALLNITEAYMPFGKAIELAGGYDWQSKFPKMKGNIERTKAAAGVKEIPAPQSTSLFR